MDEKKYIWINGYEGTYKINKIGDVISFATGYENKLKKIDDGKGYLRYGLSKNKKSKRFLVHRLVAETFIPNPNNKPCVNHIDGNKKNNSVDNLEWVTIQENTQHAVNNGLYYKKNKMKIQKNDSYLRRLRKEKGLTLKEASELSGIDYSRLLYLEKSSHKPHLDAVAKLCDFYDVYIVKMAKTIEKEMFDKKWGGKNG